MKITAAVAHEAGKDFDLEEIDVADLRADDVLVEIRSRLAARVG